MPWSHGLGDTVRAPLEAGPAITSLAGHDSVPREALPGMTARDEMGEGG